MVNIVNDVSTLSTIPEKVLNKLFRRMTFCMSEALAEDILQGNEEKILSMDIGIGILSIKYVDPENIKYHFEPSDLLAKAFKQTALNKENFLEDLVVDSLSKKFLEVYKDLC